MNGDNKEEIEKLCAIVNKSGFNDFCFIRDIENYQKVFNNPYELMSRAKEEIQKCDAILLDYDGPANGRMIEVGIAYALNKKICLIVKQGVDIKETVAGISDVVITYSELEEIIEPMEELLKKWTQ